MQRLLAYHLSFIWLLLCGAAGAWAVETPAPVTDLRVAIDVSGSMKHTDPDNLRRPALKLLTGLMPEGTRAGVWTFGQYVNMAVPHGSVDARWKAKARREADRIHSRGLYTNIEAAMEKAAFNWQTADPDYNRHLLLLTDGQVDVGDNDAEDRASRQRILESLLPRLQQAGVRIHTVGLSEEVDRELLRTLSAASGGWYEETRDSEALQRLFLRLFDKTIPVQRLPLSNNQFQVDDQIEEMTLLVFRREGDPPLSIETPKQQQWREDEHPQTVRWYAEDDYDLVTVDRPQSGQWILHSRTDPDNRVMVVTDLDLQLAPLPDAMLAHDDLSVNAWLSEGGQRLGDREFLRLVEFNMTTAAIDGVEQKRYSMEEVKTGGTYEHALTDKLAPGKHTLRVRAASQTFEREQLHHLRVYREPMQVTLSEQDSGGYQLTVAPALALFEPDSISVTVHAGQDEIIEPEALPDDQWQAELPQVLAGQPLTIELQATRRDGRDFVSRVTRHPGNNKDGATGKGLTGVDTGSGTDSGMDTDPAAAQVDAAASAKVTDTDWRWVIGIVAITNLLLILGGLAIYVYLRKLRSDVLAVEDKETEL